MPNPAPTIDKPMRSEPAKLDENQVRARVDAIRSDLAGLASAVADYSVNRADDLKERARGKANDVSDATWEAIDSAQRELAVLERRLTTHVRRHPLQSLAVAAGVGVVAAMLMRR